MLAKFASMLASAHADNESRKRREAYQAKRMARERNASVALTPRAGDASAQKTWHDATPATPRKNAQAIAEAAKKMRNAGDQAIDNTSNSKSTNNNGMTTVVDAGIDNILQEIQTGGPDALVARRPTLGI